MFIPDPDFSNPDPDFSNPDPGSRGQKGTRSRIRICRNELAKYLNMFYPKNCYHALGYMIPDFFSRVRIPGVKKAQDP
jgi:hypothetical protein